MQTTTSTTRPASGPASFNAGRGAYPKALLIPLAVEASLESRGIATDAGAVRLVCRAPELLNLGPMIAKMRVQYYSEGCSANFGLKVAIQQSVIGEKWESETIIFEDTGAAPFTGDVQKVGAWYTDDTRFAAFLRAVILVRNATGSAIETGRVWAYLEVELKS